jgi:hypothetical protein
MRYDGQRNSPGAPGNGLFAGVNLPFGGGGGYKTIQEQYRPGSSDRQRIPDPIRVFPQNEPGREGAIDVRFRQAMFGGFPGAIGNMGGLLTQSVPLQGDTINMGPAQGDYSSMPVIPDEVGDQLDRDALMEQYRNRAFPQMHNNFISPQIMTQGIPPGFVGKQVS